jgi:protein tyrosine phosphatase
MLTREVEGTTIKCGNYWSGEEFGPLRLEVLEVSGATEEYEKSDRRVPGDFFFPSMSETPTAPSETGSGSHPRSTVRRVLKLTHSGFKPPKLRRIVQFQYLDWPDLNVPGDTSGVLELIRQVEHEAELSGESRESWEGPRRTDDWRGRAMTSTVRPRHSTFRNSREESPSGSGSRSSGSGASSPSLDVIDPESGIMKHALGHRPLLLHCSAGVGRTGGFIAIDAVLDGVRREMTKRRDGLRLPRATWSDCQISRSRSGRGSAERTGHASGSSTSEKDRTSSGDEVAPMDVDEASAGGRAPPVPGLVMKLPSEDHKAVLHVPVVGVISPSSARPLGRDGALSYTASMDVDATNLASWIPRNHQQEPLSSPSSFSAHESRPPAPSGESARSPIPPALSRSLSPSGDSALSDISVSSLPLSVNSARSFSHSGPEPSCISPQRRTFNSLATLGSSSSSSSVGVPPQRHLSTTGLARPIAKRVSGSSVPPDLEVRSDSSRGRSAGASSLLSSGTKSGSPETLPTDPSLMDLSSAGKTDLESLRLPSSGLSARTSESTKSSGSPPVNEDSPPANGSDPFNSQSQSEHSPPAFDYTRPRRLHDDRHSPVLLSTLDEPIHRVIEDMREQRMSLCQSLRQYVFVHRAVIEGVLTLIDEENTIHGNAWKDKDNDLEELSKFVSARFPAKQTATSESGSIESAGDQAMSVTSAADTGGSVPAASITSVSGNSTSEGSKSSMELSPTKFKRRASPTELPKEDKRGDMRMSKRPSIKRAFRSSDEDSLQDFPAATRRVEDVALTPVATR